MRITLESNYAIRIIDCLANSDSILSSKKISDITGISLRFSLKILRKLSMSNLVCSNKGSHGGYQLTREPCDITLKDVIESVDGPIVISRCDNNCVCNKAKDLESCEYYTIFDDISAMVRNKLDSINFDKGSMLSKLK